MKPNPIFKDKPKEFWANIKLLSQIFGYTKKTPKSKKAKVKVNQNAHFIAPKDIKDKYEELGLDWTILVNDELKYTDFGIEIISYLDYRHGVLESIKSLLMNKDSAEQEFLKLKNSLNPKCPLPLNKQKNEKRNYAFLTCIVNMIIERELKGKYTCNYDPKMLTLICKNNAPYRTLSRRVDGAFPQVLSPISIWEIKEYYYTTSFGSRVADGIYETQLDGMELQDVYDDSGIEVEHYLIVDDYSTWWEQGRSYLCRIVDLIHMGMVTEALFGREVITALPEIVRGWVNKMDEIMAENK